LSTINTERSFISMTSYIAGSRSEYSKHPQVSSCYLSTYQKKDHKHGANAQVELAKQMHPHTKTPFALQTKATAFLCDSYAMHSQSYTTHPTFVISLVVQDAEAQEARMQDQAPSSPQEAALIPHPWTPSSLVSDAKAPQYHLSEGIAQHEHQHPGV